MYPKTRVEGTDRGEVMLYALSTCIWCRKTRELLDSLGVGYSFVYLDQLVGAQQDEAMDEMARANPARSFPTVVINGEIVIRGFDESRMREALR